MNSTYSTSATATATATKFPKTVHTLLELKIESYISNLILYAEENNCSEFRKLLIDIYSDDDINITGIEFEKISDIVIQSLKNMKNMNINNDFNNKEFISLLCSIFQMYEDTPFFEEIIDLYNQEQLLLFLHLEKEKDSPPLYIDYYKEIRQGEKGKISADYLLKKIKNRN
jgi:hypothetical protein